MNYRTSKAEEIYYLLEMREEKLLLEQLEALHPVELVATIEDAPEEMQAALINKIIGLDQLAQVLTYSNEFIRRGVVERINDARVAAAVRRMEVDDAADLLAELPRRRQVAVLKRLRPERTKELRSLLAYDEDTAGGIMTTLFVSAPVDQSVRLTLDNLQKDLKSKEISPATNVSYLYVCDEEKLIGVCSLRELLSAAPETPLSEVMHRNILFVAPEDDQEAVARIIEDYDLSAIPVVENGKLLGIITIDDVLDVIREEQTEDLLKLAGTVDEDIVGASFTTAVKSRMPWLAASWLGGLGGAALLGSFSSQLQQIVALAFFMPVVFGMGGNIGSQSATITVRGLATGSLGKYRVIPRLQKELLVGLLLGATFGLSLCFAAWLMFDDLNLAAIVGVSICLTMCCAAFLGSLIPLFFDKLGIDPAISSGPLVTTSTDILSILIYFTTASFLLS